MVHDLLGHASPATTKRISATSDRAPPAPIRRGYRFLTETARRETRCPTDVEYGWTDWAHCCPIAFVPEPPMGLSHVRNEYANESSGD